MHFIPTEEQRAVAEAVDAIVESLGGTSVVRDWGSGDFASGLQLWAQFAEMGLMSLTLPEDEGGFGGTPVDLAMVFERLGYHGTPGPLVESIVLLPSLVDPETRSAIASGEIVATASLSATVPFALDAGAAQKCFVVENGSIAPASIFEEVASVDPTRKLARLTPSGAGEALEEGALARAFNAAVLANTAMLLGAGERLLDLSVEYAKVREQFGRKIGEYQALKHQLADVKVALTFARPLLHGAALSLDTEHAARDVSAAKVSAAKASQLAARVGLQVHAGIGYTEEHDVSIWLRRVPALVSNWGTPAWHRERIAEALT